MKLRSGKVQRICQILIKTWLFCGFLKACDSTCPWGTKHLNLEQRLKRKFSLMLFFLLKNLKPTWDILHLEIRCKLLSPFVTSRVVFCWEVEFPFSEAMTPKRFLPSCNLATGIEGNFKKYTENHFLCQYLMWSNSSRFFSTWMEEKMGRN